MRVLRILQGRWLRGLALIAVLGLAACDSVEERITKHFERGMTLVAEGADGKAALEFRNVLKLNQAHAPATYQLGLIFERQGVLSNAMGRFERTLGIDPEHQDARVKLGQYRLVQGNLDAALDLVAPVLEKTPNRVDALLVRASVALRREDLAGARPDLDRVAALDPGSADLAVAEASYLVAKEDLDGALARLDTALADHGDTFSLHMMKLRLLERTQDLPMLGAHLAVMIERFPEQLQLRQARARWALETGDIAAARTELEALVEAQPEDEEAIAALIRFLRQHEGDAAARAALEARSTAPGAPRMLGLLAAQFDIETGQPEQARTRLETLIAAADAAEDTATADRGRLMLARELLGAGDREAGYALVDTVRTRDPRNVNAARLHINRLIEEERFDEAIADSRSALAGQADDVGLLLLAARAHDLAGNIDLANDQLARAVRADDYTSSTVAHYARFLVRNNRSGAAETVLTEAVERQPQNSELMVQLARLQLQRQDWLAADLTASRLAPLDRVRALQIRAASLIGQDQTKEGVLLLGDLRQDVRVRIAAAAALMQAHLAEGDTDAARTVAEDLLAEDPDNPASRILLGNLHLAVGDQDAARAAYQAVLDKYPDHGGAHMALVRLEDQDGNKTAMMQRLEAGLALAPGNVALLIRRAQAYELEGNFNAAIDIYDRIYSRLPDSLVIANNLASLLSDHRADEPDMLNRAYRIAGRLADVPQPHFRDTYGWTRHLKGEHKKALEAIAYAAEALPDNPWVAYHLGMVHKAMESPIEARTALSRALALSAGDEFGPRAAIETALNDLGG